MRLSITITLLLLARIDLFSQQFKSEYYVNEKDTSIASYSFSSNILLKPNKTFLLNYNETGDCHTCYSQRVNGTWKLIGDTLLLFDIYKYQEGEVYAVKSLYDSLQKDFIITVHDVYGKKLQGVKIVDDYLEPVTNNSYITNKKGQVMINKDSMKLFRLQSSSAEKLISFTFIYKKPSGKEAKTKGFFELPSNIVDFRISYKPILRSYKRTTYYLKTRSGFTQIPNTDTRTNAQPFNWGNFKLYE